MPGRHRRPVPAPTRPASATARVLLPVLAALVVVAVVVVPIAWVAKRLQGDFRPVGQGSSSTGAPVTAAPGPTPTLTASSTPTVRRPSQSPPTRSPRATAGHSAPPPAGLATLRLWITGDVSWVHVSAPGRLLIERRMVRGQTAYFAASQLFAILGNAGAVLVSVNGAPRRPAGPVGQSVRGTIHPG